MSPSIETGCVAIEVPGADVPMQAYLALPADAMPRVAVIVGSEIFGVTHHVREIVERLAELGYVAIAPDFHHRAEPGAALAYDAAGQARALSLVRSLRRDEAIADVEATIVYLRAAYGTMRVGMIGFSMGGHIAYLCAARCDLCAVAVFYAGWIGNTDVPLSQPEATITLTPQIAARGTYVLYIAAELDDLVSKDERECVEAALSAAGVPHESVTYAGAKHGFAFNGRAEYDAGASADAWKRVVALFRRQIDDPLAGTRDGRYTANETI